MNEEQVSEAVVRLYNTRGDDHTVRDYLSDLDNAFEEAAYRFATDESILEDVERYRIEASRFDDVSNPDFTDYGRSIRMKMKEPDLREYWSRMARIQRNRIIKKILEHLEEGVARDQMALNPPISTAVKELAVSLLQRKAPAHDDDREYYALCDKIFYHCYRVAIRDGYRALQY